MPKSQKDSIIPGEKCNKITIDGFAYMKNKRVCVYGTCECGNKWVGLLTHLRKNRITSCGCEQKRISKEVNKTHGYSKHKLYNLFRAIIKRCYNKSSKLYKYYGKRGIKVCDEWNPYLIGFKNAIENFIEWCINNNYNKGLTIDRIDNNEDYCPENCRFVEMIIQANNKRNNTKIVCWGETKTLAEWSRDKRCVVNYAILVRRIREKNWEPEKALITPRERKARRL